MDLLLRVVRRSHTPLGSPALVLQAPVPQHRGGGEAHGRLLLTVGALSLAFALLPLASSALS